MGRLLAATVCAAVAMLIGLSPGRAYAEKRVALVIGNSGYKHAARLTNPVNDASAIETMLKAAGFDIVEVKRDVSANEFRRAVRDFSDHTRDADIAVVYYAGHGIEVDGTNYLIPVDATIQRDIDVEDEALSLDRILRILEPAKRLRLVILDACRDNPFVHKMTRTMASRSLGRGLAKIEPTTSDTLIAFAAKADSTAADGSGINSPFTAALIKYIAEPGVDLRIAFGRVRDEVLKNTDNKQEPFVYGSLGGSTVSLSMPQKALPRAPAIDSDSNATVRRDYEFASQIGTIEAWDSFLAVHTTGLYSNLARAARAKIIASQKANTKDVKLGPAQLDCPAGEAIGDDGKCHKRAAKPPIRSNANNARPPAEKKSNAGNGSPTVVCGRNGCLTARPGCRMQIRHYNAVETCS